MRILAWHVHGSWMTAFVHSRHDVLVPVLPERGPDGLGRATTYAWPSRVREVTPAEIEDTPFDVVVLQRPHEAELFRAWTGLRPGRDVPAVYVEHNTPLHGQPDVPDTRHPLAGQDEILIAHVTGFNDLMWDCDGARTTVIDHGIIDPGHRWTGELPHSAVVVNDPVRRGRSVGTDLLPGLCEVGPVDVFGMRVDQLRGALSVPDDRLTTYEDLPQDRMHDELARRRVYVHTSRWTSLGLSLLEAMHLGMPVVVVAATEAPVAVPPEAGLVTTRRVELAAAVGRFLADRELAAEAGDAARRHVLEHYGLKRFLDDWDRVLTATLADR
jgi:Glycosyl transferases group 1